MAGNHAAQMCVLLSLWAGGSLAFVGAPFHQGRAYHEALRESEFDRDGAGEHLDPSECGKFKIVTCSSTSCTKKRKSMGINEFATLGSLWERKEGANAANVQVEESSCLGSCKLAPCVAVEHEDFVGSVGIEGMTTAEFNARVFHRIITEDDIDRVWQSVENAIRIMSDGEGDEEED